MMVALLMEKMRKKAKGLSDSELDKQKRKGRSDGEKIR